MWTCLDSEFVKNCIRASFGSFLIVDCIFCWVKDDCFGRSRFRIGITCETSAVLSLRPLAMQGRDIVGIAETGALYSFFCKAQEVIIIIIIINYEPDKEVAKILRTSKTFQCLKSVSLSTGSGKTVAYLLPMIVHIAYQVRFSDANICNYF